MEELGLVEAGYTYFIIDGGWAVCGGLNGPGWAARALQGDAARRNCGGLWQPGHSQHARVWAEWDLLWVPRRPASALHGWSQPCAWCQGLACTCTCTRHITHAHAKGKWLKVPAPPTPKPPHPTPPSACRRLVGAAALRERLSGGPQKALPLGHGCHWGDPALQGWDSTVVPAACGLSHVLFRGGSALALAAMALHAWEGDVFSTRHRQQNRTAAESEVGKPLTIPANYIT